MNRAGPVMAWARSQDYTAGQNVRETRMGGLELLVIPEPDTVVRAAWVGRLSHGDAAMLAAALPQAKLTVAASLEALGRGPFETVIITDPRVAGELADGDPGKRARTATAVLAPLSAAGTALLHVPARHRRRVVSALESAVPGGRAAALRGFPLRGPIRAVLPADDAVGYRLLARSGLLRPSADEAGIRQAVASGHATAPRRGGWRVRAIRFARYGVRAAVQLLATVERRAGAGTWLGRAVVVYGPGAGQVPAYLERLTGSSAGWAWALAAPGTYPSQKILWSLREPGREEVTMLAKMTRDPRFSGRLLHAHEVLSIVSDYPPVVGSAAPRPAFAGRVGGLAVVGEESIPGKPMGSLSDPNAAARPMRATVEWLIELAAHSRHEASGAEVAEACNDLQERLERAAPVSAAVSSALRASTHALRELRTPVPLVMQHGDPGVNNVLVRDDAGIAMLDWENGEVHGPPLWDLLYFIRSVAVNSETGRGRGRLAASLRPFTADGALAGVLRGAVHDLSIRISIPGAAIEPLVLHCWVQQALKETTRLPAGAADRSIFLAFLHELVEKRDSPVFRRLVTVGGR